MTSPIAEGAQFLISYFSQVTRHRNRITYDHASRSASKYKNSLGLPCPQLALHSAHTIFDLKMQAKAVSLLVTICSILVVAKGHHDAVTTDGWKEKRSTNLWDLGYHAPYAPEFYTAAVHTNTFITKEVPVPEPIPVPIEKHIVHKVAVPVPEPYPVEVTRTIPVPVERPVPYAVPVYKHVYHQPYNVQVSRPLIGLSLIRNNVVAPQPSYYSGSSSWPSLYAKSYGRSYGRSFGLSYRYNSY
ncbi:hypothetical protein QAD02_010338 [Eretmocerus hayati]|uniref:Uncharacterized protein n=1 Tax=Eretmocerus hayati TaxID=131215 RepID=A0ACC2NBZ5_9HYME|nr:hypothetical protein QAD02_010338 [Eretmocerus hayati]